MSLLSVMPKAITQIEAFMLLAGVADHPEALHVAAVELGLRRTVPMPRDPLVVLLDAVEGVDAVVGVHLAVGHEDDVAGDRHAS